MRNTLLSLMAVSLSLGTLGCRNLEDVVNRFQLKTGSQFGGFLIENTDKEIKETFVTGALTIDTDHGKLSLSLKNASAPSTAAPLIWTGSENGKEFQVSFGSDSVQSLKWQKKQNCFTNDQAELCFNAIDGGQEIRYHVKTDKKETSLIIDPVGDISGTLEAPRAYQFDELIEIAKSKSFTSQIQFTVAQQSRETALSAHLSLLPKVGVGDVLTVLTSTALNSQTLIKSIGDVAPFLFPSRWFKASALKDQALADQDAYLIMKADSGNLAEGLAYNYLRDKQLLAIYNQFETPIKNLVLQLQNSERTGVSAPGASLAIMSVYDALKQTEISLQSSLVSERIGISRALGFMNPDSVTDIIPPTSLPELKVPAVLNDPNLKSLVVYRALELKEFSDLIDEAKANKVSTILSLIDPSGGNFLGFGLPAQLRANQGQVNQAIEQKANEQSALLASLETNLESLNTFLQNHDLAVQNMNIQEQRRLLINNQMRQGYTVATSDLQDMLQSSLTAQANLLTASYGYYISLANLNRLLYLGTYSKLN